MLLTGLIRAIQVAIALVVIYGTVTMDLVVVVNGLLGLGTTLLPTGLKRAYGVSFPTTVVLWVAVAVLLHTLGMAGPYTTVWWWDHLTHTLSATLVASVGYAFARAFEEQAPGITLPADFLFVYVVLFTMAAGVLWEVLEFVGRLLASWLGHQPLLVQYGLQDTILDLLFDAVGAIVVGVLSRGRVDWRETPIRELVQRTR
ncbi:hypothetical protein [Halodesulfurarchaeum formicicum]|uniref:Membrane-spanning protein n=1 Tax=Halodesulfurarchaeum formicicum TaxID=1873524 RepID=A0A1J1A918_9EURY|nr:hypothetical protein [Halodesulfurarchaeum formicicum]APE94614.1 hypothetical protein HSR6_0140 [Halodesulfurarchaeum formicicum]